MKQFYFAIYILVSLYPLSFVTAQKQLYNAIDFESISSDQRNLIFDVVCKFPSETQLSIAVISEKETLFTGILIEHDSVKTIQNKDAIFEIGSLTKLFTTSLLAYYVTHKKIDLDKSVCITFPYLLYDSTQVTWKQLANHTSGFPRIAQDMMVSFYKNPTNPYSNYTRENLDEYLQHNIMLMHEPGERYNYSNTGAAILAYALSMVGKSTFPELVERHILSSLLMLNTSFDGRKYKDKLINGRNAEGEKTGNWDFNAAMGAGGMYSCISDLEKFIRAHFTNQKHWLKLTQQPTFYLPEKELAIGLGWHISNPGTENELYWHNGGTGGYTSSITMSLQNKKAVVILSNVSGLGKHAPQVDKLCHELLKLAQ